MELKDFESLEDAKAYETTQPRLIHRDTMNSILASAGIYVAFKAMALDSNNPFQNLISAFLDSTEYNFMVGTTTGDRQIQALDTMIASGGEMGQVLAQLKPVILSIANPIVRPYENATRHDFAIAKDDKTRFKNINNVPIQDGFISLFFGGEFETHAPNVYVYARNLDKMRKVAQFETISEQGIYECYVGEHRNLFIDDVYGALV